MKRVEKVFCGRMDHGGCGLLAHVEEGRILRIEGDPGSHTRGYICPKGRAHAEQLNHPNRLKYPLKRVGEKGENKWKRISWDEALETIAEKLLECKRRSGPETALFMQGTPKGLENLLLYRFARSFGSPNVVATGAVCFAPRLGASLVTTGFYPHPDLEYPPKLILNWGANHLSTSADGVLAPEVNEALRKGSRLILVDPLKRKLGGKVEMWLRPKPGTDCLLALGIIKVIIDEKLYDINFVEKWCSGIDKLRRHLDRYNLTDIECETGVPKDLIQRTARAYCHARPACLVWGNAIDHTINSVQTARALVILMTLSGNIDRPGGNINASPPKIRRPGDFMLRRKFDLIREKMIGKEFKLASMLGFVPLTAAVRCLLEGKPYKINFCYIQGSNPVIDYPDSKKTSAALREIDFLAVAEMFMTPTAAMADIVLPATMHFEFNDLGFYGLPFGKIILRRKIVDPPAECKSDIMIINHLAHRLRLDDTFWRSEEECINYILEPAGLTFAQLKEEGVLRGPKQYEKFACKGFRTPSGKVEISSTWMEQNGYPELPICFSIDDEADEENTLVFTSAKIPVFFHSMNRNISSLRNKHKYPRLAVHPDIAKKLDLSEGDWVWVENKQGKAKFKVLFDEEIDPTVVCGEHGWWFPEKDASEFYGWADSNINLVTQNGPAYEPCIGGTNLRGFKCRVRKAF